ncbi:MULTISPECIES: hypothetical protein [unclassified Frankia]|uniref:hypothetical protein n=1 Tax=unclassified Frankia TaxID=2632575 RepID=UPI00202532F1
MDVEKLTGCADSVRTPAAAAGDEAADQTAGVIVKVAGRAAVVPAAVVVPAVAASVHPVPPVPAPRSFARAGAASPERATVPVAAAATAVRADIRPRAERVVGAR